MILTIGATSKAVGLSKTTICKHIENGKLSASWNNDTNPPQREIDASEIMRVYGVDVTIPPGRRPTPDTQKPRDDTPLDMLLKSKDETIATLKAEVGRLSDQLDVKDEQLAAANRLLAAPRQDDRDARYEALIEKLDSLEKEFTEQSKAAALAPAPIVDSQPRPNQGILARLLPSFFGVKAGSETKAA